MSLDFASCIFSDSDQKLPEFRGSEILVYFDDPEFRKSPQEYMHDWSQSKWSKLDTPLIKWKTYVAFFVLEKVVFIDDEARALFHRYDDGDALAKQREFFRQLKVTLELNYAVWKTHHS